MHACFGVKLKKQVSRNEEDAKISVELQLETEGYQLAILGASLVCKNTQTLIISR